MGLVHGSQTRLYSCIVLKGYNEQVYVEAGSYGLHIHVVSASLILKLSRYEMFTVWIRINNRRWNQSGLLPVQRQQQASV